MQDMGLLLQMMQTTGILAKPQLDSRALLCMWILQQSVQNAVMCLLPVLLCLRAGL
jgi:hypothetical protein